MLARPQLFVLSIGKEKVRQRRKTTQDVSLGRVEGYAYNPGEELMASLVHSPQDAIGVNNEVGQGNGPTCRPTRSVVLWTAVQCPEERACEPSDR